MTSRDWPYPAFYDCKCGTCGERFLGPKRAPECRPCWVATQLRNKERFDAYEAEYGPYVAPRRTS